MTPNRTSPKSYLVTKSLLDLHDKYAGDLDVIDEPWVSKKDRDAFAVKGTVVLGEYISKLHFSKVDSLSAELRKKITERLQELELDIEPVVIQILNDRIIRNE